MELIDKDALVAGIKKLHGNPFYRMAIKDVLSILDTMQEEPLCDDLEEAAEAWCHNDDNTGSCDYIGVTVCEYAFKAGAKWGKNQAMAEIQAQSIALAHGCPKESITEDLGDYINELSKQFPEVSFAKLSRIAVRVSRWQRNQDTKNKLPKVINRTDLDEFAYQCAYDLSNDWAIDNPTWHDVEDACKLGAKWQKEQDQSTIELAEDHAMFAGMEKMKEEMMKDIWKHADGEDLPEIDREVIALTQPYPNDEHLKVVFAHRPNNKYAKVWNSDLGEEQVIELEWFGKGEWNIPFVKYWLDAKLPYEENKISKEIEL